jgi:hypothetical protein
MYYHVLKLEKFWSVQNPLHVMQPNPIRTIQWTVACPFPGQYSVGSGRNIPTFRCKISILLLLVPYRQRYRTFRMLENSTILNVAKYNVSVSSTITAHTQNRPFHATSEVLSWIDCHWYHIFRKFTGEIVVHIWHKSTPLKLNGW